MKILYTIAGLYRPAGMERILTSKANYLAEHGYEVVIVTTEQKNRPVAFPLNASIRCIDLGIGYEDNNGASIWNKLVHYPAMRRRHKRAIGSLLSAERPDVTVSMFCGDERFISTLPFCGKTVLEVHFSRFKRIQYGRKGLWALADICRSRKDGRIIRRFDRFVALTREDLGYWGNPSNGQVIPNFIERMQKKPEPTSNTTVLAVGRFSFQKGFERLLYAWSKVMDALPQDHSWTLRLVGDGEQRGMLVHLAENLGISSSVRIDSPQSDMDRVYRDAAILALSSRYEGLPMVLLEAQSFGIPAVSFNCKCGPSDVISDGKDGLLVREGYIQGLADALLKLITDEKLRFDMGRTAWEHSVRWEKEKIMKQWVTLFENIL